MIRVANLVKRFGRTLAVDDVSFDVEAGEIVGFLGPNGAGKTTTIRVLTCFHSATSGTAQVAGHDVFQEPVEVRANIGYLPENVPIYPDMRVREYLSYRAALKGVPRRERRSAVEAAMERCGVEDVQRKLIGHVSRGYRQRVGLADALVARPKILILDEPTSGLDPNQRRRMKALIRELSAEHTILFSSHILAEVEDVSSRIVIISNGRKRADGTIEDLMRAAPGRSLVVETTAPPEHVEAIVAEVDPDLRLVQRAADDGWQRLSFDVPSAHDPREAVAAALRQRGVALREFTLKLPSLERYFQHVTEAELGTGEVA